MTQSLGISRAHVLVSTVLLLLVLVALALFPRAAAAALSYYNAYPVAGGSTITWPGDSSWQAIGSEAEGLDGLDTKIDFVSSSADPGIYTYSDSTYLYYRVRLAYTGTVDGTTFRDIHWIMVDVQNDMNPDFAFSWDSLSNNNSTHGLEMQVFNWTSGYTSQRQFNNVEFNDVDGDTTQKLTSGSLGAGGIAYDINTGGQGYVRCVSGVTPSGGGTFAWGNSTCTFIDIAVRWDYLAGDVDLPQKPSGYTWGVQVGSRLNNTDHGYITGDVGRGMGTSTAITTAAWGVTSARQYPAASSATPRPAPFLWPADGEWRSVDTSTEGIDLGGSRDWIDFVGSSTYPGIYVCADSTFIYYRVRVAYTYPVGFLRWQDSVFVMIDTDNDTGQLPNYSFSWDSKSNDDTSHGFEMQVFAKVSPSTWGGVQFDDVDGSSSSKITSGSLPSGGIAYDVNTTGQGYVRTVDSVTVTTPEWRIASTTCAFIDFAISKSYLSSDSDLPVLGSWRVQAGSISQATDHNYLDGDVARGASTTTTIKDSWGSPTLAQVGRFRAYTAGAGALVCWKTGWEAGTAGFLLERQDALGRWTAVTRGIVPGHVDSPAGADYAVYDGGAPQGTPLTYRLREVEVGGGERLYGPYTVTASAPAPARPAAAGGPSGRQAAAKPAAPAPAAGAQGGPARASSVRVEVAESGLYVLTEDEIAAALGIPSGEAHGMIKSGRLSLTEQGQPVALMPSANGAAVYFYGRAASGPYAARNVYVLRAGTTLAMGRAAAAPSAAPAATVVRDTVHAEVDAVAVAALFHDPAADFWLWNLLFADDPLDSCALPVDVPAAVAGDTLRVSLQGVSATGRAGEHHALVGLNGVTLGDVAWQGAVPATADFAIPAGVLAAGGNTVTVRALRGTAAYSVIGVDSVDVTYQRSTAATGGRLLLTPSASGPVCVDGFTSEPVWVFDVSDARWPVLLTGTAVRKSSAGVAVTFGATAGRVYYAVSAASARTPLAVTGYAPLGLSAVGRVGAPYLVIAPPQLAAAAAGLAAYRASGGLPAEVVTPQQIYDEFSCGLASPVAVRDFLVFARTSWAVAPRYVVLAGEGSYDYRDVLGSGDCLVPSMLVDSAHGLAPSDGALTDTDGDGVADFAVGRIPAQTDAELQAYVDKLVAYEAAAGAWRSRVVMAADVPDSGGDFTGDSDLLAGILPLWVRVERAYAGEVGFTAARATVQSAFTDGALLVNYVGHGGADGLAWDGLLTYDDVPGFANAPRLPVLTAMTCVVGTYGLPGSDSLGEAVLMKAGGGAIAVWAPTAVEDNVDSVLLDQLFIGSFSGGPAAVRLGQATRDALAAFAARTDSRSAARTYALLGDPATAVSQ